MRILPAIILSLSIAEGASSAIPEVEVFNDFAYLMMIGGAKTEMVLLSRDEPPGYSWDNEYSVAVCGEFPKVHIGPEPWEDWEIMTKVIAHEAAHLIICERYGHMKADPHDAEWLEVNQLFYTLLKRKFQPVQEVDIR